MLTCVTAKKALCGGVLFYKQQERCNIRACMTPVLTACKVLQETRTGSSCIMPPRQHSAVVVLGFVGLWVPWWRWRYNMRLLIGSTPIPDLRVDVRNIPVLSYGYHNRDDHLFGPDGFEDQGQPSHGDEALIYMWFTSLNP